MRDEYDILPNLSPRSSLTESDCSATKVSRLDPGSNRPIFGLVLELHPIPRLKETSMECCLFLRRFLISLPLLPASCWAFKVNVEALKNLVKSA